MSKQVRLEDRVYERIESKRRSDESFSEAVERLISGPTLGELRAVLDEEQVEQIRDAIDDVDRADLEDVREVSEWFE
jgi:predicted CopG family antitoxin